MQSDHPYQTQKHQPHADQRSKLVGQLLHVADQEDGPEWFDEPHPARKLAGKLTNCCRHPHVIQHSETGELAISPDRCNQRTCPLCGSIRRQQAETRVKSHLKELDDPRLLTLTARSRDAPLREQIDDLLANFRKLRRSKEWKAHVTGGLAVIEITYQPKTDQWHPHLHCVIDGRYWPQARIADQWESITGDSRIVDIRRVHGKQAMARYVSKYVSKQGTPAHTPPKRTVEWCLALKGLRTILQFGSLHNRKAEPDEPEKTGQWEQVAHFMRIYEAALTGDLRARRIVNTLKELKKHRVSNIDQEQTERAKARHLRTARRIRTWCEDHPITGSAEHEPPPNPPPQRRGANHRPERLWQDQPAPSAALAVAH